ncbi:chorismate synthase [Bacillus sp. ISL-40]|uniref:chorismate synthase n=1 Tax=unclassified Bacillus (in: firmicutes) TaxID=185979 RepID=UPI001BE8A602|nr:MULTISPECIES: chorismate synthase [unclassified Bacillus (in: firmicutes)]MBT2701341.1 chorismate synthase [Bacillus sp. ISL-40]MBT2719715.1 chorismate synthase [Bacillus sp. ISL-46]MBT2742156.1 chorismate synthase [Bacillus sp. ISL-77]
MFDWFKSDSERKRDDYYELYEKLKSAISEHDHKVSEANAAYSSYLGAIPNLSNSKIPSNDFEMSREELTEKLKQCFQADQEKRSSLAAAKNKAYERYVHYKNLAIKEAEAERVRREKELKELQERLERLISGER